MFFSSQNEFFYWVLFFRFVLQFILLFQENLLYIFFLSIFFKNNQIKYTNYASVFLKTSEIWQ